MIRQVRMEFFKMKHRKVGLVLVGIMGVQFLWIQWIMGKMSAQELSQGWMSLMYTIAQLNCIIMPITWALVASRISDVEHKGNTLKLLGTLQTRASLFKAKSLYGLIYIALITVIQVLEMLYTGQHYGFTQAFPIGEMIYFVVMIYSVDVVLFLFQLILSLNFVNQTVAFAIAIGGTLLGLYSLFFSEGVMRMVVWAYYCLLTPVRMNWDKATRITNFYWSQVDVVNIGILAVLLVALFILGKQLISRREF